MAFLGPNELSVIEKCPNYRGVRKERFDCNNNNDIDMTMMMMMMMLVVVVVMMR